MTAGDPARMRPLASLPEAARAYRMAAEASPDEAIAEQATRMAFEHAQMVETALAAERWLVLNPTSEQARRFLVFHLLDIYNTVWRNDLRQAGGDQDGTLRCSG